MDREDFWFHPECRTYGAIPTGTRWGPWLFLSAQMPVNLETGRMILAPRDLPREGQQTTLTGLEFVDGRLGPVKAQTWAIYSNLSKILAQQGSSLDHVVRQRIYLRTVTESAAVEEVVLHFFPRKKPATTVQGMARHGLQDGLLVQIDAIALLSEGGLKKELVTVPGLDSLTAPYPLAVKSGDFLFTSGIIGMNLESGRAVCQLTELDSDTAHVPATQVLTDGTAEAVRAQISCIFRHFERLLESQGAPLGNLLHTNIYVRQPWSAIISTPIMQEDFFGGREHMPTISCFQTDELHAREDVRALADAVALLPGSWNKETGLHATMRVGVAPMWARGGPFWFVSGDLAVDPQEHKVILQFGDLADEGRWLAQGCNHNAHAVMAQAWYVYRKLELALGDVGSQLQHVIHQNIFLKDLAAYPGVERVASMVYRGSVPPTTVIAVDNMGPYDDVSLEIEVVALAQRSQAGSLHRPRDTS